MYEYGKRGTGNSGVEVVDSGEGVGRLVDGGLYMRALVVGVER